LNSGTEIEGVVTHDVSNGNGPEHSHCEVAVIGAGPYGLSAGSHLKAKGIGVRVFGEPMEFWAKKMPEGMLLRSPRVASNISDPNHAFTLEAYEAAAKVAPRAPLPLDTFVEYGRWFRHQLGSDLDQRTVARVDREQQGFRLTLQDGEIIRCGRVVVATGIGSFKRKPELFQGLPEGRVSHCYEGRDVSRFSGRRVAVIGAGQSALESAALIHEAGADVEIIVRNTYLRWIGMHKWLHQLGPISKMLYSQHDVGPIGVSRLVAYPTVVSYVPLKLRDKIRKRAVRPAGSPWLINRVSGTKVTIGRVVQEATTAGNQVKLKLDDGTERRVDHVVLGTGYDVDISRYDFLPPALLQGVRQFDGYPKLAAGFLSSVPGLHFIGATAARSFGPLLYFVAGTEFASRELVSRILRTSEKLR
jgi:cation diffusion facilitator CzcD-associated flavoprotein CzcO